MARCFPTGPFQIEETQNQEIGKLYVVHKRHGTDFEAPNCEWIGRVGNSFAIKSDHPRGESAAAKRDQIQDEGLSMLTYAHTYANMHTCYPTKFPKLRRKFLLFVFILALRFT